MNSVGTQALKRSVLAIGFFVVTLASYGCTGIALTEFEIPSETREEGYVRNASSSPEQPAVRGIGGSNTESTSDSTQTTPQKITDSNKPYGEWIFPTGKSKRLGDYSVVFIGALWELRDEFQRFVNDWSIPGFFIVPAKRQVYDLLRLVRIKFIGRTDPFAKDLAESMRTVDKELTIYALSQGVLATVNAIRHHGMSNRHKFVFFSPAASYPSIRRNIPKDRFYSYVPWFDASSAWAPSYNPLRVLSGLVDLACGACRHEVRAMRFHFVSYHLKQQYPDDEIKIKIDFKLEKIDISVWKRTNSTDGT